MTTRVVLLVLAVFLFSGCVHLPVSEVIERKGAGGDSAGTAVENGFDFGNPKKSAHYESNTPSHGSVLAGVPVNVVVDVNFDLAKPSAISIKGNGVEYGEGDTVVYNNKLAMRRAVRMDAPDGLYAVSYEACWPDGSCHGGNFKFAIDRKLGESFVDMTGKKEVGVDLANYTFVEKNIRISRGTKMVWTNRDADGHYINTDSHPAHTYLPTQNSKLLSKGDSFELVFEKPGVYPYHCSAHASNMTATILVE